MPKKLYFPKDELAHQSVIEWWYFNGNLSDHSQNQYAYMYCLFKADPKKVKLPFLEKIPVGDLYFSHYLISDNAKKRSKSGTNFFYEGMDEESFSQNELFIKGKDLLIEEKSLFDFTLKNTNLNLNLYSKKSPLLINDIGWIDLGARNTYYYSLTSLETKGTISIDNKKISVEGKSWMDHQWADNPYSTEDKWVWFSIQLDNQTEILCAEYGDRKKTKFASISYSDGKQTSSREVKFTSMDNKWTSPATKAEYTLGWKIELPDKDIRLIVKPKILEQEVIFGSINYWEGAIDVTGDIGGQRVSGQGFLELVGVPMGNSIAKYYLEEAKKLASGYLSSYITRP